MSTDGPGEETSFWNLDTSLGEVGFGGEVFTARASIHTAAEGYRERREIVPLRRKRGTKDYVQVHPYILVPSIRVIIGLYSTPQPGGAVGEVTATEWEGMEHRRIGDGQAWYYREDRTIILWELTLFNSYRAEDPSADTNLAALWRGFERFLLEQFNQAERIATPSWEPTYETAHWRQFLSALGYAQHPGSAQAFIKAVRSEEK